MIATTTETAPVATRCGQHALGVAIRELPRFTLQVRRGTVAGQRGADP